MSSGAPAPGWYADPDDPTTQRYWDGQHWLVPSAMDPQAPARPAPSVGNGQVESVDTAAVEAAADFNPGWYSLPDEPGVKAYWNGRRLYNRQPGQGERELPRQLVKDGDAAATRQFLWTNYIVGALIPIYGLARATYIGVSDKYSAIRRHAFGIAAVAVLVGVIWAVVISSINSSRQDPNVAAALTTLLQNKVNPFDTVQSCVHDSGNQYTCDVNTYSGITKTGQTFVNVTDDGNYIYEQGLSANGG